MGDFLDRAVELGVLERAWRAPGSNLTLVWGRRRTGKTRLLGKFLEGRPAVYHGATQQAPAAELAAVSASVRAVLPPGGTDLLGHGDFPTWASALEYLAARARRRRLAVVLDEFPYLVASDASLPSVVQRFWDQQGGRSLLHLILCGSAQSVMEDLQASSAPLFGRIDTRLQVRPFGHREAGLFLPRLRPAERALAYGVLGGMPSYLSRWDDRVGRVANLRRLFGDPSSPLLDEGEFVLTSELPEASGYFRIIHGIASGHRTFGALRQFAAIDIARQLDRLVSLGLVLRDVPVTENPLRTRQVTYRIADHFLRFWFRLLYRHRADVARGQGRQIVDRLILPRLDDAMGEPWEDMCRDHVRRMAATGALGDVTQVGRWWSRDGATELDVVGLDGKTAVLAGTVKWARTVDRRALTALARDVQSLPKVSPDVRLVVFARERIRDIAPAEALTFTAADLFDEPARQA